MTKGKHKKIKNYENLFIFATTPSLSGRGEGLLQLPLPLTLFIVKIFEFFFIDTLVSGQRVGKLAK